MQQLLAAVLVPCFVLVLPLGVRLLAVPLQCPLSWWVVAGTSAASSLALPPGATATVLAVPLAGLCLVTALAAVPRGRGLLLPGRARALAALSAGGSLGVVAGSLLVDRSGLPPFLGFDATTWRLTVVHFCVAGLASSLLVGHAVVAAPGRATSAACALVPSGTALVATGHFLGDGWELAGALSLTAGLLLASVALLRRVVRWSDAEGQLLGAAALVTPVTMALALWWAAGEAADMAHPTLTWTAATHGVGNALGIGVAGVLAWTTLAKEQL